MSSIQSLRGQSGAAKYRAMVADVQGKYWNPNTNSLCIPVEAFDAAIRAGAAIAATGAKDVQSMFAYSSIVWRAPYDGVANGYVLLANDANVRRFFQYGTDDQNQVQILGGYPAGYTARWDDTNLVKAGKPPFGSMLIERIGLYLRTTTQNLGSVGGTTLSDDPIWAEMVLSNMHLAIGTQGSKRLRQIGSPMFWAGAGGMGPGAGANDSGGTSKASQSLGLPAGPVFTRELEVPMIWTSAGGVDDDLVIEASIDHDILYPLAADTYTYMRLEMWCVVEGRSAEDLSANGW